MAIAMISGCRSHKTLEESAIAATDSCTAESIIKVQSLTKIAVEESTDTSACTDYFDFEDGAGIVQIHSDGEVTIKGLNSASLTHKSSHKTSDIQISESDSLLAEFHSESYSTVAKEDMSSSETPSSNSTWIKRLLLVIIFLLVLMYLLRLLKGKLE